MYTYGDVIGKGAYGVVMTATDTITGLKVAIKRISVNFKNINDYVRVIREMMLLRHFRTCEDVIRMHRIIIPEDREKFTSVDIVFELMETTLFEMRRQNHDLTALHRKVIMFQILRGLRFMHANGVMHRDLKPQNILINSNCKTKIADFGLARPFEEHAADMFNLSGYVTTRWYRAPEVLCVYGEYTDAIDIWAVGCIFAELITGFPLFHGCDTLDQLRHILSALGKPSDDVIAKVPNDKAKQFLRDYPPIAPMSFASIFRDAQEDEIDLLTKLLVFDKDARISAHDAMQHRFFDDLHSHRKDVDVPIENIIRIKEDCKLTDPTHASARAYMYNEALLSV